MNKIIRSVLLALFYAFALLFLLNACTQSPKEKAIVLEPKETKIESAHKYSDYLLLMTEEQRFRFFQCEDDSSKERFLQREGLLYAKYLQDNLKVGFSSEKVIELLGKPMSQEVEMDLARKETCWIYSQFNGYRVARYALCFNKDNRLTSWSMLDF